MFPRVIDSSQVASFSACPKQWYWQYFRSKSPSMESTHLIAGAAYAKGLEVFRKGYFGKRYAGLSQGDRFEEARVDGYAALVKAYGTHEPNPDGSPSAAAKTLDRVIAAYIEYFFQYPPEQDVVKPVLFDGEPLVEHSGVLPLEEGLLHPDTGEPILYGFRFDMLAHYLDSVFILDDKTTYQMGPQWSQNWALRAQFTGYTWGGRQFHSNIAGVIVRGMAIQKTQFKTQDAILYRPQFMVDRWHARVVETVKRMIEMYKQGHFPNSGEESGACSAYGGCAYTRLCESPNPEEWLDNYYVTRIWKPYEQEIE